MKKLKFLVALGLQTAPRGRSPGAEAEIEDALRARAKTTGTISAIITRANGDVEDLGVISSAYMEEK